jgi:hypothetical protein
MTTPHLQSKHLVIATLAAVLGGYLYGYDTLVAASAALTDSAIEADSLQY